MPNIIAICKVLHNLCIIDNERIQEDLVVEAKKKNLLEQLLKENYEKAINCR